MLSQIFLFCFFINVRNMTGWVDLNYLWMNELICLIINDLTNEMFKLFTQIIVLLLKKNHLGLIV